jgi:hypothetical protein
MKPNPGQRQHQIPLTGCRDTAGVAIRTGNNAAWLCPCGYAHPLVGYSDAADSQKEKSRVICQKCGSHYRVVAPSRWKAPTEVVCLKCTSICKST